MSKLALALCLLVALAVPAAAEGLFLRWNLCAAEGGVQNRDFACNVNTGAHWAVGSFRLGRIVPGLAASQAVLDVATASETLPEWWQFRNPGACRLPSLSVSSWDGAECPDAHEGQASTSVVYEVGARGANTSRILSVNTVPPEAIIDLSLAPQRTVNRWVFSHGRTVGTGACPGCSVPACIVLSSVWLITLGDEPDVYLTREAEPGSNYITWQGGGGTNCPAATPTKHSTWGAMKSLYR